MIRKLLTMFIACLLVLGLSFPALAEDADFGAWCPACGTTHGPGESCPNAGGSSSTPAPEPYDWSQPVSPPVQDTSSKLKEVPSPGSPSTVDLSDKVDPLVVKGLKKGSPEVFKWLSEEELMPILLKLEPRKLVYTRSNKIFETNPNLPLINPLREPELYKAWEEKTRKILEAEAREKRSAAVVAAMDKDKKLSAATERTVKEEFNAIKAAAVKILKGESKIAKKIPALEKWSKLKYYENSSGFTDSYDNGKIRKQWDSLVGDYRKKIVDAEIDARKESFEKMKRESIMFLRRHPELKKK